MAGELARFGKKVKKDHSLCEAEYDLNNYVDRGECYPPTLEADADNQ